MNRFKSAVFSSILSALTLTSCKTDFTQVPVSLGSNAPVAIYSSVPIESPAISPLPSPTAFPIALASSTPSYYKKIITGASYQLDFGGILPPLDDSHFLRKVTLKSPDHEEGFYNLKGLEGKNLKYYSEVESQFLQPGFEVWNWGNRFNLEKVSDPNLADLTIKYCNFDRGDYPKFVGGGIVSGESSTILSKLGDFYVVKQEICIKNGLTANEQMGLFSHELGHLEGLGHSEMNKTLMYPIVPNDWNLTAYDQKTFGMLHEKTSDFNLIFEHDAESLPNVSFSTMSAGAQGRNFENASQFEFVQLD